MTYKLPSHFILNHCITMLSSEITHKSPQSDPVRSISMMLSKHHQTQIIQKGKTP